LKNREKAESFEIETREVVGVEEKFHGGWENLYKLRGDGRVESDACGILPRPIRGKHVLNNTHQVEITYI
jgi:hypothetical protein